MNSEVKYLYVENNIDEGMDNCFNCAFETVEEYLVENSDIEEHKSTVISCNECGALWNNITRRAIAERARAYMKHTRVLLLKLKQLREIIDE
jgi:uncharacterized Zn finger protein|tara:strand:- start:1958 stop:2233 length:276 start_codon:yes stop_codon:yes gene_type:complete